jgi:O-antigen/teichoic acid export membrane protein
MLILVSLLAFYAIFRITSIDAVYLAYYSGIGIILIIGIAGLASQEALKLPEISLPVIKSVLYYGINNEFNYLIQFLNYRLSYYFIAKLLGLAELGVFSVAIAVSEAVWIISRSMSAIHFSNVINSGDQIKNRNETIVFVKQSLRISSIVLALTVLLPESMYRFVFGEEFGHVRRFIIYLIPGVIAIAVSNLYGHYFAGSGRLRVLTNKSLIGLGATLILLPLLIKKYQLTGVCITLNVSYILSSLYLWLIFRKEKNCPI